MTGSSSLASTGARDTTPTIARASGPSAMKPSSNFSPSPKRLPIARSRPPSTMQIIRIQTMTSLTSIAASPQPDFVRPVTWDG